jgi:hypothetical protein
MSNVSRNGNIFEDVAIKAPVRLASTLANLTLSGEQTIDGVAAVDGDRILVTAQTDETQNGIWQVSTGLWQRTADARNNTDFIDGTLVPVARGNTQAGKVFQLQCIDNPVTIDTSELVFMLQADIAGSLQAGTSATSAVIGTGAKTFASQAGKDWSAGQWLLIFETSAPANAMLAQIDSYADGALEVTSVSTGGSGTHADWTIVLANSPASAGRVPPIGTGNMTGPGSSTPGNMPVFADPSGKVLEDSGIAPGTLAGRDTLLYGDAGTASIAEASLVPGSTPLSYCGVQPNDNLHLVNDASNPNRDVNITPGRCRDDSDVTNLHLVATMVKRLDQAWAPGGGAGAPAGACDTGTKGATQTWHQFLIAKHGMAITAFSRTSNVATITVAAHGGGVDGTVRAFGIGAGFDALAVIAGQTTNTISYANTGSDVGLTSVSAVADVYDVLASQNYLAPTLPAGWTAKQCLGSFLTDGSGNIRAVSQIGDEFLLATSVALDLSGFTTTGVAFACAVPLGVKVKAKLRVAAQWNTSGIGIILFSAPDESDQTAGNGNAQLQGGFANLQGQAATFETRTNLLGEVRAKQQGATSTIAAVCYGWTDPRRRLF